VRGSEAGCAAADMSTGGCGGSVSLVLCALVRSFQAWSEERDPELAGQVAGWQDGRFGGRRATLGIDRSGGAHLGLGSSIGVRAGEWKRCEGWVGVVGGGGQLGVAWECLAEEDLRSRQKQIELA
jgi:hypothetical protein